MESDKEYIKILESKLLKEQRKNVKLIKILDKIKDALDEE